MLGARYKIDPVLVLQKPANNDAEVKADIHFPLPKERLKIQEFIHAHGKIASEVKLEKDFKEINADGIVQPSDESFWHGVVALVGSLQAWISDNFDDTAKRELLNEKLTAFVNEHFTYKSGEPEGLAKLYFNLYTDGLENLSRILILIKGQNSEYRIFPIETRKKIIDYMILGSSGLLECPQGAHTNIYYAYLSLTGNLAKKLMAARQEIAGQVARGALNEHAEWDELQAKDELHYVATVLNENAEELQIEVAEDSLARAKDEILATNTQAIMNYVRGVFPTRIQGTLNTETLLRMCLFRENIADTLEKYGIDFTFKWSEEIEFILNGYGEDPQFHITDLSVLQKDGTLKLKHLEEIELYFLSSLLVRLDKNPACKGVDLSTAITIEDNESKVCILPNNSIALAFVDKGGERKPLISSIFDQYYESESKNDDLEGITILQKLNVARHRAEIVRFALKFLGGEVKKSFLEKLIFVSVNHDRCYFRDAAEHLESHEFHLFLSELSAESVATLIQEMDYQTLIVTWSKLRFDLSRATSNLDIAKVFDPALSRVKSNEQELRLLIRTPDRNGNSLLHIVAKLYSSASPDREKRKDQMNMLVQNGSRFNVDNKQHLTPTHIAIMNRNWECVAELLALISRIAFQTTVCVKNIDPLLIEIAEAQQWLFATEIFTINNTTSSSDIALYYHFLNTRDLLPAERSIGLMISIFMKFYMVKAAQGLSNTIDACPESLLQDIFLAPHGIRRADAPNLYNLFNVYRNHEACQKVILKLSGETFCRSLLLVNNFHLGSGLTALSILLAHLNIDLVKLALDKAIAANRDQIETAFYNPFAITNEINQYISCALQNPDMAVVKAVAERINHAILIPSIIHDTSQVLNIISRKDNPSDWMIEIVRILSSQPESVIVFWNRISYAEIRDLSAATRYTLASEMFVALEKHPEALKALLNTEAEHKVSIESELMPKSPFDMTAIMVPIQAYISENALKLFGAHQLVNILKAIIDTCESDLLKKIYVFVLLQKNLVAKLPEALSYKNAAEAATHLEMDIKLSLLRLNVSPLMIGETFIKALLDSSSHHDSRYYKEIAGKLQEAIYPSAPPQLAKVVEKRKAEDSAESNKKWREDDKDKDKEDKSDNSQGGNIRMNLTS